MKKIIFAFALTACISLVTFSCTPNSTAEEDAVYEQGIDRLKIKKLPTNGIDRLKIKKLPTNG